MQNDCLTASNLSSDGTLLEALLMQLNNPTKVSELFCFCQYEFLTKNELESKFRADFGF